VHQCAGRRTGIAAATASAQEAASPSSSLSLPSLLLPLLLSTLLPGWPPAAQRRARHHGQAAQRGSSRQRGEPGPPNTGPRPPGGGEGRWGEGVAVAGGGEGRGWRERGVLLGGGEGKGSEERGASAEGEDGRLSVRKRCRSLGSDTPTEPDSGLLPEEMDTAALSKALMSEGATPAANHLNSRAHRHSDGQQRRAEWRTAAAATRGAATRDNRSGWNGTPPRALEARMVPPKKREPRFKSHRLPEDDVRLLRPQPKGQQQRQPCLTSYWARDQFRGARRRRQRRRGRRAAAVAVGAPTSAGEVRPGPGGVAPMPRGSQQAEGRRGPQGAAGGRSKLGWRSFGSAGQQARSKESLWERSSYQKQSLAGTCGNRIVDRSRGKGQQISAGSAVNGSSLRRGGRQAWEGPGHIHRSQGVGDASAAGRVTSAAAARRGAPGDGGEGPAAAPETRPPGTTRGGPTTACHVGWGPSHARSLGTCRRSRGPELGAPTWS